MAAEKQDRPCSNCGRLESEHALSNFADGPHIGQAFLVCPKAVFRAMGERPTFPPNHTRAQSSVP